VKVWEILAEFYTGQAMKTNGIKNSLDDSFNQKQKKLLNSKICDLPLKIPGTKLEKSLQLLYTELESVGISFRPGAYLSDEWGCPQGVPVIAVPFYLADAELTKLEGQLSGTEAEDESEVLMYLRHECGHSFNYAYRLFKQAEWSCVFGKFTQPYREAYKTRPFSTHYVRHIGGWYVQKHPDEDFAETFAVWLTPGGNWKELYADTPALEKLNYVDRIVKEYGHQPPLNTRKTLDKPLSEFKMSLLDWHATNHQAIHTSLNLPPLIAEDLKRLFPDTEGRAAVDVIDIHKTEFIRDVNYWTGLDRHILGTLLAEIREMVRKLDLKIGPQQETPRLVSASAFLTTLAMNFQYQDQFVEI
jgi:hypothetical protein